MTPVQNNKKKYNTVAEKAGEREEGGALTMVPTEMRPSCVCMNTTRNSVTAEICCVTAKVLVT